MDLENLKIAEASSEDVPVLNDLIHRCYRTDEAREGWCHEVDLLGGIRATEDDILKDIQDPQGILYKLFCPKTGKIIGCVSTKLYSEEKKMYFGLLSVEPKLQSKGLGKMLMKDAVEARARREGCQAIFLKVIHKREDLIAMYEKQGFIKTGESYNFFEDGGVGDPKLKLYLIRLEKKLD